MASKDYFSQTGKNAVREAMSKAPKKATSRTKTKSAKARNTKLRDAQREASKRKTPAQRHEGRVQEATTKLLRKGVRSYDDARSMAEYGLTQRTTPAIPEIDKALRQIAGDSAKAKKAKQAKKAKRGKK
jgi:hypothetical protein